MSPIGRVQTWHGSYVLKIVKNRSVLGEFQPHKLTSGKRLVSSAALRGENGAHRVTIRYEPFEQQMLTWLGGLDEATLVSDPDSTSGRKELAVVDGRLVDVKDRIAKVEARMVDGPSDIGDIVDRVVNRSRGRREG